MKKIFYTFVSGTKKVTFLIMFLTLKLRKFQKNYKKMFAALRICLFVIRVIPKTSKADRVSPFFNTKKIKKRVFKKVINKMQKLLTMMQRKGVFFSLEVRERKVRF